MKGFTHNNPTEIVFGAGRIGELGRIVRRFGTRCLLVTGKQVPARAGQFRLAEAALKEAGVSVVHYDGVVPNPTVESIAPGARLARDTNAEVIVGLGGGSSMDSAKAIAVEATHVGSCWDYLFYKSEPTEATLPVIAVPTTSGTGSQVTQVAAVTDTATRDKSAIYSSNIYPRVALIDPELAATMPPQVTASTGFDAFCHAFESLLHPRTSPMVEVNALEAMRLVSSDLPVALGGCTSCGARSAMALADTLAGLCISGAGVTLPHGIAMALGGMYPHVAHGEALAIVYPAFMRFTYRESTKCFATAGRILERSLRGTSEEAAAERACEAVESFLRKIGLWKGLADIAVPENEIPEIAKRSMMLPDYKQNPRVATVGEIETLLRESYASRTAAAAAS